MRWRPRISSGMNARSPRSPKGRRGRGGEEPHWEEQEWEECEYWNDEWDQWRLDCQKIKDTRLHKDKELRATASLPWNEVEEDFVDEKDWLHIVNSTTKSPLWGV